MFDKPPEKESLYRVSFILKEEIYEVCALGIANSNLFGFVEIDELVWDAEPSTIIDPAKERVREKFKEVACIFVPVHAILHIDLVEFDETAKKGKTGSAKSVPVKEGSNVMYFPKSNYTPTHTNATQTPGNLEEPSPSPA